MIRSIVILTLRSRAALGRLVAVSQIFLSLASCTQQEHEPDAHAVASISTTAVARADVAEWLTAYGVLEPAPNDELPINVDVESSVVRVLVKAGQPVQANEALVEVRASGTSRLDAERARIDVGLATKDLTRLQTMLASGLATNAEVAQQAAALDKAKAEAALFGSGGRSKTLRAPASGLVRSVVVKPGDVVAPGGPLIVLAGAGARRVRLGIEPVDVFRVKAGARVRLSPVYAPGATIEGTVMQVHPHVDADTHLATAVAVALQPSEAFVDGALCRGDVVVREEHGALVVPRASVVTRAGEAWVFLVEGAGATAHARRVPVRVVLDDGSIVAVDGAVTEGALVIVMGVSEVEDGMAVRVAAAGGAAVSGDAGSP